MALHVKMKTNVPKSKVKSSTVISAPSELAKGLREARPVSVSRVVQTHQRMMKGGK